MWARTLPAPPDQHDSGAASDRPLRDPLRANLDRNPSFMDWIGPHDWEHRGFDPRAMDTDTPSYLYPHSLYYEPQRSDEHRSSRRPGLVSALSLIVPKPRLLTSPASLIPSLALRAARPVGPPAGLAVDRPRTRGRSPSETTRRLARRA